MINFELVPENQSILHANVTQQIKELENGSCIFRQESLDRPNYSRLLHELVIENLGAKQKLTVIYQIDGNNAFLCGAVDKNLCSGGSKRITHEYPSKDGYFKFHKKTYVHAISWHIQLDAPDCNLVVELNSNIETASQNSKVETLTLVAYGNVS